MNSNLPRFEKAMEFLTFRQRDVLNLRSKGYTYEAIGECFNVTRQNVHQAIKKALDTILRIRKKFGCFYEDKYKYLYETYNISKEIFIEIFEESELSYFYLETFYQKGCKDYLDMMWDNVPISIKKKLYDKKLETFFDINGTFIPKTFRGLVTYVMKTDFECNACNVEELRTSVVSLCEAQNIHDFDELIYHKRNFKSRLVKTGTKWCLLSANETIKYYDMDAYNLQEIASKIDLQPFMGNVISTEKIFQKHKEYFKSVDICNKYELHNWIRKNTDLLPTYLNVVRMPHIEVGKVNREEQALKVLKNMDEVRLEEIALSFYQTYGIDMETFCGSWSIYIKPYRTRKGTYKFYRD